MAGRRKKKSGSSKVLMIVIAVLALVAIGCGMFYANSKNKKDVLEDGKNKESAPISLLDESIEAQRLVDTILLQKDNWQLVENEHGKKEVDVEGAETKVNINQRALRVGVPNTTSVTGAGEWLKEKVEAAGLVYMNGKMVKYKNWDAFEAQVGIKVKAGKGTQSFMTDKITFIHNGNLTKEDKDVKDLPEEPAKEEEKPEKKEASARQFKGRLAIVVDDCGADLDGLRTLLDTGLPFSYAILPNKPYSSDALHLIKSRGRTAMLHLPMEPMNAGAMSEGSNTILVSQSDAQKAALARKNIAAFPGIEGINNHQGSRATSDRKTMQVVLREIKKNGLFFMDSRTYASTIGNVVAKEMGVPTARNDIFLDNSTNPEDVRAQIYKAMALAEKQGSAIAICHVRPGTVACWKKYAAEFKKTGITFVPVKSLLY